MIADKDIPEASLKAARDALFSDKGMRAAIAAALSAWEGARIDEPIPTFEQPARLILPLPTDGGRG